MQPMNYEIFANFSKAKFSKNDTNYLEMVQISHSDWEGGGGVAGIFRIIPIPKNKILYYRLEAAQDAARSPATTAARSPATAAAQHSTRNALGGTQATLPFGRSEDSNSRGQKDKESVWFFHICQ